MRPTKAQEKQYIEEARNNPEAFQHLFNQYHDEIYNYVLRRLYHVALAKDITASTFIKALEALPKYVYQGVPFSAWLYRIAINEINLNYRKAKRMTELSDVRFHCHENYSESLYDVLNSFFKNAKIPGACSQLSFPESKRRKRGLSDESEEVLDNGYCRY